MGDLSLENDMLRVGVIGCGYWGPNLIRNFVMNDATELLQVADLEAGRLQTIRKVFATLATTTDAEEVFSNPEIDLVAIATPVSTHYPLAKRALEEGKHVLIEKPLTANSGEAEELCELAETKGVLLFVDHTLLFTGAVRKLKELVDAGELGEIRYVDSTRINLGLYQDDVSVIWDIGPHELSILQLLLGREPDEVSTVAASHVSQEPGLYDIAYISLKYGSAIAHISVSWLSPVKIRQTIIGGTKRMAIYNDLENVMKLQIYDVGAKTVVRNVAEIQKVLVEYRRGDMYAPILDTTEALRNEVNYVAACIENGERDPVNSGRKGLAIVRALEAADRSAASGGAFVKIAG